MSALNQTTVNLVGAGGTPPYSYAIVAGAGTTIPATLSGTALTVDATGLASGTYTVEISITDQLHVVTNKTITVEVVSPNQFSILNRDIAFQPNVLPFSGTLPLQTVGGTGTVTYALLPQVTTLPGVSISGSNLVFTLFSVGEWAVGIRATDSLGQTATRILTLSIASAQSVAVIDGHARIRVSPTTDETGTHQFTLAVADATATVASSTFGYKVDSPVSSIDVEETAIDYFWGATDTTKVVYPIAGDLSGFAIGPGTQVNASNGLSAQIDPTTNSLIVTGPPSSFRNSEIQVPVAIVQGATQVATITRTYTLVTHSGVTQATLGNMTCYTRPYITGDMVGLNPERPYFNSPTILKNAAYKVQLAPNNTLPLGLSLDSITGLIYGRVLAADVAQSVLQYVDGTGTVQGTITVVWDIVAGQFQLVDQLTPGQLQASYSATIGSTSSALLVAAAVHRGTLPQGLSLSLSGDSKSIVLSGTPTSAGYYDLWIQVTNANGQVAFLYRRLVINYVTPLAVVTDSFPSVQTLAAYSQTLHGVGGVAPYTWSVDAGTLPNGFSLNPASGVVSGSTTDASYNQNVTFEVTDARGVGATRVIPIVVDNTLRVSTPVLPLITAGVNYSFQLQAVGGQGGYVWALGAGSPALPGGFSLSSSGVLSGAASLTSYTANIIVQVTDAANNVTTKTLALTIGASFNLLIDTEGVGPIVRGGSYSGRLAVIGNGLAPYTWSISPDTPNALPAGFHFSADASTNGATATLSGSTTSALLNDSIKVQVVDANGNSAFAFLLLNSYSSLAIVTSSLPQATVSGNYSVNLAASGLNPGFTWSLAPGSPALPAGLSLSSAGVISGVPTGAANVNLILKVTDALGDSATRTLNLTAIASTLAITTSSLPAATAGVAYSTQLAATGGNPGYTWSISPNSGALLPAGLSLNPATGQITGTTLVPQPKTIIFRVTDSIGVYREQTLTLVVNIAITLKTGPDFVDGTTTNSLGLIAQGDVTTITENNKSFLIVESNPIGTSAGAFSFGLPAGFSATFLGFDPSGPAVFRITGPFASGIQGDNVLNLTFSDSGVNLSATFHWTVYTSNSINLVPSNGPLPTR